ncbi:MAG: serine acetyltransferase [FCB group bacterium]|nr:serine acetyltransferase [FCB group bacterium]
MTEQNKISNLVGKILLSYEHKGFINRAGGENLPSQQHIIDIMQAIRMLLFPGYYDRMAVDEAALPYATGERIVWLYKHLSAEIYKCLCFEENRKGDGHEVKICRSKAEEVAMKFLEEIPSIRDLLHLDVQAAMDGDPAADSPDEIIMAYPSIAAITVHRIVHQLHLNAVPLLPRIMSEYIHHRTGIDIHPGAQIGKSFFIDHGTGVVIGETTIIGDHVKVYQGVTLGALSVSRNMRNKKRHPTIEDHVTIYSGATILGGNTVIGKGSVIGGNVWIIESVSPNSTVYSRNPKNQLTSDMDWII